MTLPKNHCVQVPCKYIKICGYSDHFSPQKNFQQKGQWPKQPQMTFDPHPLRSHVQLYQGITVSISHGNTSKCVDTMTLFSKTLTKGQ